MEPAPELEVSKVSFASYIRILRENRNFRRLWMAQIVSEVGDWFYTLAIYTLLLQLTGKGEKVLRELSIERLFERGEPFGRILGREPGDPLHASRPSPRRAR